MNPSPKYENVPYRTLETVLNSPTTRIIDSRMLELNETFSFEFQILFSDKSIMATTIHVGESSITPLDLFKLAYRNSPRMNPGLYGLLDEPKESGENNGK